jgi:hypothetical protein
MKKDHKDEAARIHKKMGYTDGKKHLDMILCFVAGMNSVKLENYWKIVDKHFKNYEKA